MIGIITWFRNVYNGLLQGAKAVTWLIVIALILTHPALGRMRFGDPPFMNQKTIQAWREMNNFCTSTLLVGPNMPTCHKWADDFNTFYEYSTEIETPREKQVEVAGRGKP